MVTEPINPYQPGIPTADPARFFNREEVFAFIRQGLNAEHRSQALAVIGPRGSGKTSILLQLPHQLDARTLVALVDLSHVDSAEPDSLPLLLVTAIQAAFESVGISTYRLPEMAEVDRRAWFLDAYLDVVLSILRNNRRLLFAFDEPSHLIESAPDAEFLADLLRRDERVDMLFALDSADEERAERLTLLADPMLYKRLAPLPPEAADALTRQPVARIYELQDEAVSAILSLAGGQPTLLHVVNRLIFERSAARQHDGPIILGDVKGILPQAIADADPILRAAWDSASLTEQQALTALAALTEAEGGRPIRLDDLRTWLLQETEEAINETTLAAALRSLEYAGAIRTFANRRFTFTAGLQQQWLLLHGEGSTVEPPPPPVPPGRRGALPLLALLGAAILVAGLIGRFASANTQNPIDLSPTVTLGLDINATQRAIDATNTQLAIPTNTPTFTPTRTNTPSATPTFTFTPSNTPTWTLTPSDTPSLTFTSTYTRTYTPTATFTPTFTPSYTSSPTFTFTPSNTPTQTPTATLTPSLTLTPTPSTTSTPSETETPTDTPTASDTPTPTDLPTVNSVETRVMSTALPRRTPVKSGP